jgi:putative flippase GtrA
MGSQVQRHAVLYSKLLLVGHRLRGLTRYTIVSVICLIIQNIILISSDFTSLHYQTAVILSTIVLIPVGFLLQAYFTFSVERTFSAFFRYSVALSLNLPLTMLIAWILCGILKFPMMIASPVMSVMLYGWNYFATKWALSVK